MIAKQLIQDIQNSDMPVQKKVSLVNLLQQNSKYATQIEDGLIQTLNIYLDERKTTIEKRCNKSWFKRDQKSFYDAETAFILELTRLVANHDFLTLKRKLMQSKSHFRKVGRKLCHYLNRSLDLDIWLTTRKHALQLATPEIAAMLDPQEIELNPTPESENLSYDLYQPFDFCGPFVAEFLQSEGTTSSYSDAPEFELKSTSH